MADPRPPKDGYGPIVESLKTLQGKVRTLETASGTQRANLRAEVLSLFDDLSTQVQEEITLNSMTAAEIEALVAAPPSDVAVEGNLSAGGTATFNGVVSSPGSRANPIATFRTVVWREDGSDMGYSSSTRRVKQDITDLVIDEAAFRAVHARDFRYIADVEANGDEARTDRGFIAEELVDAGITEPVYFDADGIPEGINYDRLTPFLWAMTQQLLNDRDDMNRRLKALENGE